MAAFNRLVAGVASVMALASTSASALDNGWYPSLYTPNYNGAMTLRDGGGQIINAIANPNGSSSLTNSYATQPAMMIKTATTGKLMPDGSTCNTANANKLMFDAATGGQKYCDASGTPTWKTVSAGGSSSSSGGGGGARLLILTPDPTTCTGSLMANLATGPVTITPSCAVTIKAIGSVTATFYMSGSGGLGIPGQSGVGGGKGGLTYGSVTLSATSTYLARIPNAAWLLMNGDIGVGTPILVAGQGGGTSYNYACEWWRGGTCIWTDYNGGSGGDGGGLSGNAGAGGAPGGGGTQTAGGSAGNGVAVWGSPCGFNGRAGTFAVGGGAIGGGGGGGGGYYGGGSAGFTGPGGPCFDPSSYGAGGYPTYGGGGGSGYVSSTLASGAVTTTGGGVGSGQNGYIKIY